MPVELCVHSTGPLNDGVPANRIIERSDQQVRASRFRSADGFVHVWHQITRPF
jgi:hypothetical protein